MIFRPGKIWRSHLAAVQVIPILPSGNARPFGETCIQDVRLCQMYRSDLLRLHLLLGSVARLSNPPDLLDEQISAATAAQLQNSFPKSVRGQDR